MKIFFLTLIIAIGFNACSGEYYELKKSPCACVLDSKNSKAI